PEDRDESRSRRDRSEDRGDPRQRALEPACGAGLAPERRRGAAACADGGAREERSQVARRQAAAQFPAGATGARGAQPPESEVSCASITIFSPSAVVRAASARAACPPPTARAWRSLSPTGSAAPASMSAASPKSCP